LCPLVCPFAVLLQLAGIANFMVHGILIIG